MFSAPSRKRMHWGLALAGLMLAIYYGAVYRPLSQSVHDLDVPLRRAWEDLGNANQTNLTAHSRDEESVLERLQQVESHGRILEDIRRTVEARLALPPEMQARLQGPFQLLEYQNERQFRVEDTLRAAALHKVALASNLTAGFPEYSTERKETNMLWAQLYVAHQALLTALQCQVATLHRLECLPMQAYFARETGLPYLDEIKFELELSGPAPAVDRFLVCTPLRAPEMKSLKLFETPPAKPALFISRVTLRREEPEKLDQVRLVVRLVAYVYRD